MSQEFPSVSLTVVAYNSALCLPACLTSVRPEVLSGFAELIVVDNGSPDDSADIVKRDFPEATLIRSERNRKFAGGCNLAWPQVRGPYWLLLNPDAIVPEGALRKLVTWMDNHPELGAASPKLVDKLGRDQCAGRRFLSLSGSLLQLTRLHLLLGKESRAERFLGPYWDGSDHTNVDWVPGAALIARREAVEDAGLLSESVLFYAEDSEWCWRLRKAGWKIGVCGEVSFFHEEGRSTSRTWNDEERTKRVWLGLYDACREMRGSLYTSLLTAVNALAFAIEAYHPGRSKLQRSLARRILRAHLLFLRGRHATTALRRIANSG